MKTTVSYNIKMAILFGAMTALPFSFGGCEKDPVKPNQPTQSKTYTYIYDNYGIPQDTVLAHTDVDTFYVIPKTYNLFATAGETTIHNVRVHLENCQNMNPKTHGKGPFKASFASYADSAWLANFGYQIQR